MSELLEDIGRSLMLAAMMGIPYQEAREWKPGDMPSWVQKRFLERQPPTAMEVEQAVQWRLETLEWIENKLDELKAEITELGRIERAIDESDLADMVYALEIFKERLNRTFHYASLTRKVKKEGKEVIEFMGMKRVDNKELLIEEYRAR